MKPAQENRNYTPFHVYVFPHGHTQAQYDVDCKRLTQAGEVFCMQDQVEGRDGLRGWVMGNLHSLRGGFQRGQCVL